MMPMRFGSAQARAHDRVDAGLDVLDAVDAQRAVVEVDELLSEARRAAHVRREDRDAAREQRLVRAVEAGPLLALRDRRGTRARSGTGAARRPACRASRRARSPSWARNATSSGRTSFARSTPACGLCVTWRNEPVATSMTQTSAGVAAPERTIASGRPSFEKSRPNAISAGSFGLRDRSCRSSGRAARARSGRRRSRRARPRSRVVEREALELRVGTLGEDRDLAGRAASVAESSIRANAVRSRPAFVDRYTDRPSGANSPAKAPGPDAPSAGSPCRWRRRRGRGRCRRG